MPFHLLLSGVDGDAVLVDAEPGKEFLAYLERAGLPRPRTTVFPETSPDAEFVPFGWNDRASALNSSYARPANHPSLEVVKRVNGRRFAARIEADLSGGAGEVLGVFTRLEELEGCIALRPSVEEWLLKSEHGNAALGNRRLKSPILSSSDRKVIRRLLSEDECLLLERWRQRVFDIATVFRVEFDGSVEDPFSYEFVNTTDGAYIGSIFERDPKALDDWLPTVDGIVSTVAGRLSEEGYYGPVCLDHFVWTDGEEHFLRPLADLNARLQVSAPLLHLWKTWGGDRVFYWRLFAARKLLLPPDFEQLEKELGAEAFDPASRCGVLVTSPLTVGGERLRRIGVLLSAQSRAEVEEMDRWLRERFER